jgi:hypothetical protein
MEGLIVQELSDEVLVYDLDRHKAHCLNKTAAFVWRQCDGANSVGDIARKLEKEFEASVDDDIVWGALLQLEKSHLLQERVVQAPGGRKVTRRDLMRKATVAAALALPLVTSIVAPTAAAAVSCLSAEAPCTVGGPLCCPPRICRVTKAGLLKCLKPVAP